MAPKKNGKKGVRLLGFTFLSLQRLIPSFRSSSELYLYLLITNEWYQLNDSGCVFIRLYVFIGDHVLEP